MRKAPLSHRRTGPTADIRAKAIAAKRQHQGRRQDQLQSLLLQLEVTLSAGTLRVAELTHNSIYERAGLSRATYWRYLKADKGLRAKATALTRTSGSRIEDDSGGGRLVSPRQGEDPLLLEQLQREKLEMAGAIANLQRQLAAAKTLVELINIDLRAKTSEVRAKNFLLGAEREAKLKLAEALKKLVTICQKRGLEVDVELSAYASRPRAMPITEAAAVPRVRPRTSLSIVDPDAKY